MGAVGSCGHRDGRGLGLEEAVPAEHGVDEGEQLSHEGDEGDLLLGVVAQALAGGLEPAMAARRGGGGHVEQLARMGEAAATAGSLKAAELVVEGSDAEQGGGLAARRTPVPGCGNGVRQLRPGKSTVQSWTGMGSPPHYHQRKSLLGGVKQIEARPNDA